MYGVTKALQRARPTHPSRAWLTLDVKSNGWLRIGALNAPSKITIAPSPQLDHCVVLEKYLEASRLFIDRATNTLSITPHHPDRPFDLEIAVPEYFNVDIKAAVLNLCITKKMLGDVSVRCNHGTVVVDKLKGSSLHFGCGNADLHVNKSLEGSIKVISRSLTAKMIHASTFDVATSADTKIEALYCESSDLKAGGHLVIGMLRGFLKGFSGKGDVDVKGIDGSFSIESEEGDIRLQINKLVNTTYSPLSAHAVASKGSLSVLIDGQVAAAIDLETLDPQSSVEMINVNNFEGELYRTSVRGLLTGSERSRSSSGAGSRKSGKIDTDQAAVQALSLRSNMERGSEAKNIAAPLSIFLRSKANLYFEMLSWMDAIRRRHGL